MISRARRAVIRSLRCNSHRAVAARLYTGRDCHLCAEALEVLEPFLDRDLQLTQIDVRSDPDIFRRYACSIPVLELADGTMLEWPFTRSDVRRVLA